MVVTFSDGKITELKGCTDRAAAVAYAQAGESPAGARTPRVQSPDFVVEPPGQRVERLVPFVRVADVERSAAFYRHLGFTPTSIYRLIRVRSCESSSSNPSSWRTRGRRLSRSVRNSSSRSRR
jgi:hypothetical protein